MTKENYEVQVTGYSTVLVIGAQSEDEALAFALDEVKGKGCFEIDEARLVRKVPDEDLARARKYADAVSEE